MDDSDIRHNPHPKQAYEVTVQIQDAPGPFDFIKAELSFQVSNPQCVPADPFSGAKKVPTNYPTVALKPLGSGYYSGTIYLDLLQDDNYFGLGTCHWEANGMIVTLGAFNRTYGAHLAIEEIRSQQTSTRYVPRWLYAPAEIDGMNYPAGPLDSDVKANPGNFFSITLTAKERHGGRKVE